MMMNIISYGDSPGMSDLVEFQTKAKNTLKGELKRRGVSYRELADKLATVGVQETERNIANKISRGSFSAAFFVECLSVIGCKTISLED